MRYGLAASDYGDRALSYGVWVYHSAFLTTQASFEELAPFMYLRTDRIFGVPLEYQPHLFSSLSSLGLF